LTSTFSRTFRDKKILITGGTGTIGSAILKNVLKFKPRRVTIFSRDEMKHYNMSASYEDHDNVEFVVGDVRNTESLQSACRDIDIIFHLAALKQVPICDKHPFEAVMTNIHGTMNVARVALRVGAEKLIYVSTDKAVHPSGVMGATKLIAEKIIVQAAAGSRHGQTFCNVRFGNVLNSRGSVIPKIVTQLKQGGPVTLTDPRMTRFLMDIDETINLLFEACTIANGGETFVLKMKAVRVEELIKAIIAESASELDYDPESVEIKVTGIRSGEKLHEELVSNEELDRTIEMERMMVILPFGSKIQVHQTFPGAKYPVEFRGLRSDIADLMSVDDIRQLLRKNNDKDKLW